MLQVHTMFIILHVKLSISESPFRISSEENHVFLIPSTTLGDLRLTDLEILCGKVFVSAKIEIM